MNIIIVAGARPNFIKIAPIIHAIKNHTNINYSLVHTGQHYNDSLNEIFFRELNIPAPDINFNVGSGSHAQQTAAIMIAFEDYLKTNNAELILVVGDVNSTMACSIVAKKMHRQLIHVEAGIRSFDLNMPEEINRLITDSISDHFFTTSEIANKNLIKAGVDKSRIHFVGNTMIDTLLSNIDKLRKPDIFDSLTLRNKKFWILTLHRPSNVDDENKLIEILSEINRNCGGHPVLFPVHPRTKNKIKENFKEDLNHIKFIEPLGYLEFMFLVNNSIGVITDSGGIQEETTTLHVPCLTLRENTERMETVITGTNKLIPELPPLRQSMKEILEGKWKKGEIPELWDGKTSERIIKKILELYS
jgi:UDP-N-acetylglucosamine 2-epimerase (non-hydrolysing)